MNNKIIPIKSAKDISKDYEWPEIVIFAYDPKTRMQHVTTFGKTKAQCIDAAKAGNHLKKHLGWPEQKCHATPSRATPRKKTK